MIITGRANVTKSEDVKEFLEAFYSSSGSSFNVKSGKADRRGKKDVEVYGHRKCIMKVHKPNALKPRMKGLHQDCPAGLSFRLDRPRVELPRDSDTLRHKKKLSSEYPFWFSINYLHNHEVNRQDHKRFRSVGQETKDTFIELFKQDMTPSSAWEHHRKMIQEEFPDDYYLKFGDRHICPDYFWAFKFYRIWIVETLGSFDGVDAYLEIVDHVKSYNENYC